MIPDRTKPMSKIVKQIEKKKLTFGAFYEAEDPANFGHANHSKERRRYKVLFNKFVETHTCWTEKMY